MSIKEDDLSKLFNPKVEENLDKPCVGLVFKAENTTYKTKKGFANTIKLNISKKLSCPGCKKCGWLKDVLDEFLSEDTKILGLDKVKDGKYYTLTTANISTDWETGYVDDYDLKIIEWEKSND